MRSLRRFNTPWNTPVRSRSWSSENSGRSRTPNKRGHRKNGRTFLVGVTGGIGSGKSTVCSILQQKGRVVISADDIARELTGSDPGVRRELARMFGTEIFRSDGTLDRREVGRRVFKDESQLRALNKILHPRVLRIIMQNVAALPREKKYPYVVVDAPLIFEAGIQEYFDRIVLVDAPLHIRASRVRSDRKISKAEILRRARMQFPSSRKRELAHIVIRNSRSFEELRKTVNFVDYLLLRLKEPWSV